MIWLDECYIYLSDGRGDIYVTQRPGEEFHEDCVAPIFKQSPIQIMVWGCIMEGKKGPLLALEYTGGKGGGMNAQRYWEQVLEAGFHDWYMERCEELGQVVFQQDGAASHRAKETVHWFLENHVDTFPRPSSSPDLSPIEPIWDILKGYIRARPRAPTSFDELKTAVFKAWDSITKEDINKHVWHMEDRVQDVIAAKGGHTRF